LREAAEDAGGAEHQDPHRHGERRHLVRIVNLFANGLLRLMGVRLDEDTAMPLSREELRTV